jgi:hypothetical protein
MPRTVKSDDQFSSLCNIKDREGDFYIIRKGQKQARVIQVGQAGEGELVDVATIQNERKTPKPENPAAASGGGVAPNPADNPASTNPNPASNQAPASVQQNQPANPQPGTSPVGPNNPSGDVNKGQTPAGSTQNPPPGVPGHVPPPQQPGSSAPVHPMTPTQPGAGPIKPAGSVPSPSNPLASAPAEAAKHGAHLGAHGAGQGQPLAAAAVANQGTNQPNQVDPAKTPASNPVQNPVPAAQQASPSAAPQAAKPVQPDAPPHP